MSTQPLDVEDLSRAAGDTPWSGLPPGTVLGHVHLFVADLERAAAFYHRGLGLDQTVWSYPGALFMSAGGYHHHLGTNTWAQGAISPSSGEARLLEWEIVLPTPTDTSAALASLEAVAGAGSVERTADGGVTHDPWGTTLRLRTSA